MSERKRKINLFLHSIEYFIAFGIFFLFGIIHTLALETKTIYSVNNNGTLSSANTYNYGYMTGGGTQGIARATVGNTVSGVAYGFSFSFYENIVLNKTYTMVINFKDSDLLKSFSSDMVQVSTCNNNTCNENILVSVMKNNNNGNSNKLTIQFNPITTGAIILVNLGSDQPITGVSTFGISSVTLDSSNQNEDIMNNANQNANNIINNQNSNTQDIINNQNSNASVIQDTINDNFNTTVNCPNLFDISKVINNSTLLVNNGTSLTVNAPSGNTAVAGGTPNKLSDYCPSCIVGETYYLSAITTGTSKQIYLGTSRTYWTFNTSKTLTQNDLNSIVYWYASGINTSATISNIQIEKGNTSSSYCVYGSSSSVNKLDQQTNSINNLNDSINDDDIGGATQDGADFILDFDTNTFGLTSIVTAPLNLIQSLTSSTCSELELPLPFLNNKKLILPCMTTIYQSTFGSLFTMYQTITFGRVVYWLNV